MQLAYLVMVHAYKDITPCECSSPRFLIATIRNNAFMLVFHRLGNSSSRLVHAQCHNVWVKHGGVEWCDEQIEICEHNCHGAVDDTVRAVNETLGLVGVASVRARRNQRRIAGSHVSDGSAGNKRMNDSRQVELLAPSNPFRCASGGRCHVAIIRSNSRA